MILIKVIFINNNIYKYMNDIYYYKYIKYKQKYLNLKDSNGFVQADMIKQNHLSLQDGFVQADRLKQKYLALKDSNGFVQSDTFVNQQGGSKKTYYINNIFKINDEVIEYMKSFFIKKGWIESLKLPIDFIYINNKSEIIQNFFNGDSKKSELINSIKGTTFDNININELFLEKYKKYYFIHPFKIIDINNIPNIYDTYRIRPIFSKNSAPNNLRDIYQRKLVSSKKEIEEEIKLYPEYKWVIKNRLSDPSLKNGHQFSLNCIFIIKLKPFRIYLLKKKLYIKAKKMFNKDTYYTDNLVYETSPYHIFDRNINYSENKNNETPLFFPDDYPDGWTKKETLFVDKQINDAISILFNHKIDLKPNYNSKNGFYIFNAAFILYNGLPPFTNGIYYEWYPFLHKHIIPGLISILIDNKDHPDFKRVNLNKKIKDIPKDNYQYERQFSYGRQIMPSKTNNTFYIKTDEYKFDEEMNKQLIEKGYKKSTNYPVDFIFIQGDSSYYRNRFNTKGSNWISLLYGNSKAEISNKILLHKKYEKSEFIIPSLFLTQTSDVPDVENNSLKILKPLNGFSGSGITIIQNKNEIVKWLDENKKYKEWLLQDYIKDPNLKEGKKFHLRVIILVKVTQNKPKEVYICNYKFYILAREKYKMGDWLNKNIHDTHYKDKKMISFPEELPDDWDTEDTNKAIKDMNNIIREIFVDQNDFNPEWNAVSGFELFGADILFSKKKAYVLEINSKIGITDQEVIVPGIIETVLENKENKYFTKLI